MGFRLLLSLLGWIGLAVAFSACSTTYTEAEVESADYDAQGKARREEVMDTELGAMGGRNAEALGEEGEEVIIQGDR
jgi:hypothetical protein